MKREAETAWAAERVENALLRERINDVAAEVARLTAVLEGPGSPIETMLAVEANAVGQGMANGVAGTMAKAAAAAIDSPRRARARWRTASALCSPAPRASHRTSVRLYRSFSRVRAAAPAK